MTRSIRLRIIVVLIPTLALFWLLSTFFIYKTLHESITEQLDNFLIHKSELLLSLAAEQSIENTESMNPSSLFELLPGELRINNRSDSPIAFQMWIKESGLFVHSNNAPFAPMSNVELGFSDVLLRGDPWRVFSQVSKDGRYKIQVGSQVNATQLISKTFSLSVLVLGTGLTLMVAFIMWFNVDGNLKPLGRLAAEIRKRRTTDLHRLDDEYTPIEIRPIQHALNTLFIRLKTAFDTERRFTADAAHELRTPLAALKTHAEVALQAKEDEEKQQALRQVVRGVNRSTRLVEQLLTLARLDPETGLKKARRFDLFIVAETVIGDEAPIAIEKDIEIGLSGTRGKFIRGDYDAIAVLVRNLTDNAIRYTPEKGSVEVNIGRKDDRVLFSVGDSGPGIPPAEREKVFKRFYRQLGTKATGSGLGLSIVGRIADLHHLDIKLSTSHLGGLQVDVWFPAVDSEEQE
ncbi:MAG: ATP-binding protein [Gammaproteobacteria bacterium]|nr:ATP-binding protein [Gammaproteobacteria bacterium]